MNHLQNKKKKGNLKKDIFTGVLIGFIATAIGFYFYTQVFNHFSMKFVKKLIAEEDMLGTILAYSVMPNALAFFVFIKRKEDYKARGVMIATFVIAIAISITLFM